MVQWSLKTVENKLKRAKGYDSFISHEKGYLLVSINKTDIVILREEVGVSYYFLSPIQSVLDANYVNDFMSYAASYLRKALEQKEDSFHI